MSWKRQLLFAVALFVFLAGTALAQDEAVKGELAGGFSYLRTSGNSNLVGFNTQGGIFATKWFGLVGDFSGHYQSADSSINRRSAAMYEVLGGPRFVDRAGRLSGFAHYLFGVSHIGKGIPMKGGPVPVGTNGFTMMAGGGMDVNVSEKLAVRVFEANWEMIRTKNNVSYNMQFTNNFRMNFGIVLKLK